MVSSEGATGTASVIKYTTSTNPASLTWSSNASPFSGTSDISHLFYHSDKQTWTCSNDQSVFAYSTDGVSWTTKDLGWTYNGQIILGWVPWHNRWVAVMAGSERQFAYSNTSNIAGSWTLSTASTSTALPKEFETIIVDPNRRYILTSGKMSSSGHATWSL